MRVCLIMVFSTLLASVSGQQRSPLREGLVLLCVADFDSDGMDDILAFGRTYSRTYYGMGHSPFLRRGPDWQFEQFPQLMDVPVFVGGHLYVPTASAIAGEAEIRIYDMIKEAWTLRRIERIRPSISSGSISSVRVHPLHKDMDGDKLPDLVAAWSDVPMSTNGSFYVGYVSLGAVTKVAQIKRLPGQTANSVVVDVHRIKSIVATKTPEYLVSMSCNIGKPTGGFGFVTVSEGPAVKAGIWASGGPGLDYANNNKTSSPICYGRFNISPTVKTPFVRTTSAECVLFSPWVLAPYVHNKGEFLKTSGEARLLDQCVADYDGDGRDEAVLVTSSGRGILSYITVADPSSNRAYAQVFSLGGDPQYVKPPMVYHGAAGDFDGDGDQDILISYRTYEYAGQFAYLGFFQSNPKVAGKPSLTRIY